MSKKKRLLIIEIILFIIIVLIISMVYNYFVNNKIKEDIKENSKEESKVEVLKITNNSFEEEVLNSEGNVIIDFYADWCGPCKMMSPIIDNIAEENPNVKVGKVNVDEAQDLAMQYNVMSIPTIIIFKDGKVQKKFVGVTGKEDIVKELN